MTQRSTYFRNLEAAKTLRRLKNTKQFLRIQRYNLAHEETNFFCLFFMNDFTLYVRVGNIHHSKKRALHSSLYTVTCRKYKILLRNT